MSGFRGAGEVPSEAAALGVQPRSSVRLLAATEALSHELVMFRAGWEGCHAHCSQQNGSCMFVVGASVVLPVLMPGFERGITWGGVGVWNRKERRVAVWGCPLLNVLWEPVCERFMNYAEVRGFQIYAVDTWSHEASVLRFLLAFSD